jgi:hypothetical protein
MPDNQAVIKVLYQTNGVADVKAGTVALKQSEQAAKSVTSATMGSRREFRQLASAGVAGLSAIGSGAGSMNRELAGAVSTASQLAQGALFGGAAGLAITGISLGVGALAKALFDVSPEIKSLNAELAKLAASDSTAATLARVAGVSVAEAQAALEAAKSNKEFANELARLNVEATKTVGQGALDEIGRRMGIYGTILDYVSTRALPRTTAMLKSLDDETTSATESQVDLGQSIKENAAKINEQNRLLAITKTAIPQAATEIKNYNKTLADMTKAHRTAQSGFGKDIADAEKRAGEERIKIEGDVQERINEIREAATESATESARDHARRIADIDRDIAETFSENTEARVKAQQDAAKEIARIGRDLADELEGISRSGAEQESTAKSWAEVLRIRRDQTARANEARKKSEQAASEKRERIAEDNSESAQRSTKRRAELQEQKQRAIEEYNHARELDNRKTQQAIENAQKNAREQIASANERLTRERATIEERKQAENNAYAENRTAAYQAHNEKIRALFDERTETQRLAADWLLVRDNVDAATRAMVAQSQAVPRGTTSDFQTGYRPGGWYASGLDAVISKPTMIGVGESGAERVTVTPLGAGTSAPMNNAANQKQARGDITINISGSIYGVNDLQGVIQSALDRYDRGLR